MKIGFVGAGNMSEAIISGMIKKGFSPEDICVIDIDQDRLLYMQESYKVIRLKINDFFKDTEVLIMAVKPQVIQEVLLEYKDYIRNDHLLISIAAGITINDISKLTNTNKIIRVMPNTPSLISQGISGLTFKSTEISNGEKELVEKIMESIGVFVWLEESKMNAVTALSGSGPAYVYRFIEAMIDGGELVGLSRELSKKLVLETVIGSALMIKETNKSPKELECQVTSPGGTTFHGLLSMEENNFSNSVKEGIKSAYKRAEELGRQNK